MKKYLAALLISLVPMLAIAASGNMDDMYFSNNNPKLTPQEKTAIDIAERWKASSETAIRPVSGPDGSIQFPYGISQVSVVCAVLQVCDIELEPGEQVNNINVGDTRWNVEPAITGYGEKEVQHLVVKPLDVGLDTSMVVTTNRRTYHFRLRSHRTKFMPHVTFMYPEHAMKKWETIRSREEKELQGNTLDTGEYLGDLDFHYKIEGTSSWRPMRVYNDGVKTIIQMPSTMSQTEAPTLLVLRGKESVLSWSKDTEEVMVNYRVQGDRYIVDTIFDRAILIAGVGSRQDRVTISREGKK
jgi:type IV secretion system protein VirB9